MGSNRKMNCFVAFAGVQSNVCCKCKWVKPRKPSGENPGAGKLWCDKRHMETSRQRRMDCFER